MSDAPEAGDLVWMNFHPQAGQGQAGRRPALVLSPSGYHEKTALAIVCPITSNIQPYPFKVPLPAGLRSAARCSPIRSSLSTARRGS